MFTYDFSFYQTELIVDALRNRRENEASTIRYYQEQLQKKYYKNFYTIGNTEEEENDYMYKTVLESMKKFDEYNGLLSIFGIPEEEYPKAKPLPMSERESESEDA